MISFQIRRSFFLLTYSLTQVIFQKMLSLNLKLIIIFLLNIIVEHKISCLTQYRKIYNKVPNTFFWRGNPILKVNTLSHISCLKQSNQLGYNQNTNIICIEKYVNLNLFSCSIYSFDPYSF